VHTLYSKVSKRLSELPHQPISAGHPGSHRAEQSEAGSNIYTTPLSVHSVYLVCTVCTLSEYNAQVCTHNIPITNDSRLNGWNQLVVFPVGRWQTEACNPIGVEVVHEVGAAGRMRTEAARSEAVRE
jgi:hypothetical protein